MNVADMSLLKNKLLCEYVVQIRAYMGNIGRCRKYVLKLTFLFTVILYFLFYVLKFMIEKFPRELHHVTENTLGNLTRNSENFEIVLRRR